MAYESNLITPLKWINTNRSDGFRDMGKGQRFTAAVFVYNCVSMPSKLNGRKVTRKYMRVAEKIKI